MARTFTVLLRRACATKINTTAIPCLIRMCQGLDVDGEISNDIAKSARQLLVMVSRIMVPLLRPHISLLEALVNDNDPDIVRDGLYALKRLFYWRPNQFELTVTLADSLEEVALSDSPVHAKYAVAVLCASKLTDKQQVHGIIEV